MVVLKIYLAAVCILVGMAILITIPVAIYFLFQDHEKENEE